MSDLAPRLLVAAPSLSDPRFYRSVVLLAEAGEDGALGFVLNRRTPYTFGQLAKELGILPVAAHIDDHVNYGGPVSPERGWLVFKPDFLSSSDEDDAIIDVGDVLRVSATMNMLDKLLSGDNAPPFRLFLGYAGWGPQQLEAELAEGSWLPLDLDPSFVFDVPDDEAWDAAIKLLGLNPGTLVMGRGGAA